MSAPSKAMLLCAGLGTRMRPLTNERPKPLIEVGGKTLLDRALDWFDVSGVGEVVVNTHYKADMISAHLEARTQPKITLSYEPVLLETGGGIAAALPLLGDGPFFSANSDAICVDGKSPALSRLTSAWRDDMDALLLVVPIKNAVGYDGAGDFFVSDDGSVKRRGAAGSAPYIFTGVQLLHPRLFAQHPEGPFSLNILYNRNMAADGTLHRIKAIVHDGAWLHVGDPAGLALAEDYLKNGFRG